jgi:hypothetical protein
MKGHSRTTNKVVLICPLTVNLGRGRCRRASLPLSTVTNSQNFPLTIIAEEADLGAVKTTIIYTIE